jgi:hypothetical protein
MNEGTGLPILLAVAALLVAMCSSQVAASEGAQTLDQAAVELLRESTSYLAGLERFGVETDNTLEVVLASGQKIQLDHAANLLVQRPNQLRAERRGEIVDQVFYYDGKRLTLVMPEKQVYATVEVPDTIEGMLDFARDRLEIFAPGGDLIYRDAFDILTDGVTEAFVVGRAVIHGKTCAHLAFRAEHVDWQIWIEEGEHPLPRKFVITSTDVRNAPQFAVTMTNWNTAPNVAPEQFAFVPAEDMQQIDFLLFADDSSGSE